MKPLYKLIAFLSCFIPAVTGTVTIPPSPSRFPAPTTIPQQQCDRDLLCGPTTTIVAAATATVQSPTSFDTFRSCGFLTSSTIPFLSPIFLEDALQHLHHHFNTDSNFPLFGFRQPSDRHDYLPPLLHPFDESMFAALLPSFWDYAHATFGEGCCELAFMTVLNNGPTFDSSQHQDYHSDLLPSAHAPHEQMYVNIDLNTYRSGGLEIVGGCFGRNIMGSESSETTAESKRTRQDRCGQECTAFVEFDGEEEDSSALQQQCSGKIGWYRSGTPGSWTIYTPSVLHRGRALVANKNKIHQNRRHVLVLDLVKRGSNYRPYVKSYLTSQGAEIELEELRQRRVWFEQHRSKWIDAGRPSS